MQSVARHVPIRVYRRAVDLDGVDVHRIYVEADKRGRKRIFNPDQRRSQALVRASDPVVRRLITHLESRGEMRGRRFRRAAALVSLPGCKQQAWHTDYDPTCLSAEAGAASERRQKPASAILGLQEHTRLAFLGGHVALSRGDVVVFDGDVVHAGAAYSDQNIRLFVYLDAVGDRSKRNFTWYAKSPYCLDTCHRPDDGSGPKIQCRVCERWFHCECVGVQSTAKPKLCGWQCARCRSAAVLARRESVVEERADTERRKKGKRRGGGARVDTLDIDASPGAPPLHLLLPPSATLV